VPYKQIFFFTRPWDINEPADEIAEPDDDEEDDSLDGSWDDEDDDSWDDEDDDGSWDDEDDDSWDDEDDDDSWDDEDDGDDWSLKQDGDSWDDSWDEDDSWDDSYDDSWDYSYDDSWDTSFDDSWDSLDESVEGSEAGSGEGQGFHMWVGGAYDVEFGNFFISYCEGAYTGTASIWTISSSVWTNNYAPGASSQMKTDCWVDPELILSVDMLFPKSLEKMVGQVQIYEA